MNCPNCNNKIKRNSIYCDKCGTKVDNYIIKKNNRENKAISSWNLLGIFLILILIPFSFYCLSTGIGGLLDINKEDINNSSSNEDNNNSSNDEDNNNFNAINNETDNNSSTVTVSQLNALRKAKSYLKTAAFSYEGLIEQLEYEKFTHDDAVYGVDNCGADWNEQAAKKAQSYLKISPFSRDSLIEQLEYEKFTHEQAIYGVEQNGL